jgi:hypothetical protein
LVKTAIEANAPPKAWEPVSPIKISAGCELYQRKAKREPAREEANTDSVQRWEYKGTFR